MKFAPVLLAGGCLQRKLWMNSPPSGLEATGGPTGARPDRYLTSADNLDSAQHAGAFCPVGCLMKPTGGAFIIIVIYHGTASLVNNCWPCGQICKVSNNQVLEMDDACPIMHQALLTCGQSRCVIVNKWRQGCSFCSATVNQIPQSSHTICPCGLFCHLCQN